MLYISLLSTPKKRDTMISKGDATSSKESFVSFFRLLILSLSCSLLHSEQYGKRLSNRKKFVLQNVTAIKVTNTPDKAKE